MVRHISAITLAVADMARAVHFYQQAGFEVHFGGPGAEFSSLAQDEAIVNLILDVYHPSVWWGRVILRVDDADAAYRQLIAAGLHPDCPHNGEWGERFFHLRDPDGHELSFAQLLDPARELDASKAVPIVAVDG